MKVLRVLVSRGLLHEDLYFYAPFALELVWPKVGRVIADMQNKLGAAAWENVAWLAQRYQVWTRTRWQAKLDAVLTERGPSEPPSSRQNA